MILKQYVGTSLAEYRKHETQFRGVLFGFNVHSNLWMKTLFYARRDKFSRHINMNFFMLGLFENKFWFMSDFTVKKQKLEFLCFGLIEKVMNVCLQKNQIF